MLTISRKSFEILLSFLDEDRDGDVSVEEFDNHDDLTSTLQIALSDSPENYAKWANVSTQVTAAKFQTWQRYFEHLPEAQTMNLNPDLFPQLEFARGDSIVYQSDLNDMQKTYFAYGPFHYSVVEYVDADQTSLTSFEHYGNTIVCDATPQNRFNAIDQILNFDPRLLPYIRQIKTGRIHSASLSSNESGRVTIHKGAIQCFSNDSLKILFYHEIGHVYEFTQNDNFHASWAKAMEDDGNELTIYSKKFNGEDFAEFFALYFFLQNPTNYLTDGIKKIYDIERFSIDTENPFESLIENYPNRARIMQQVEQQITENWSPADSTYQEILSDYKLVLEYEDSLGERIDESDSSSLIALTELHLSIIEKIPTSSLSFKQAAQWLDSLRRMFDTLSSDQQARVLELYDQACQYGEEFFRDSSAYEELKNSTFGN